MLSPASRGTPRVPAWGGGGGGGGGGELHLEY